MTGLKSGLLIAFIIYFFHVLGKYAIEQQPFDQALIDPYQIVRSLISGSLFGIFVHFYIAYRIKKAKEE